MAGLTLTTAAEALKEDYKGVIREQINQKVMLLNQIEKNTDDVEGKRAILSLHVTRNTGVGNRAEGGTLPSAGNQGHAEERIPLKYSYGRLQVSGPVIRAMKSDRGSFARAVQMESKGLVNDLRRDVNRQLFGTSDGVVATATTTNNSTTLNLATTTSVVKLRQIADMVKIDVGTTTDVDAVAAGLTVSAVDYTNKTVTVDSAITTTSSHRVFRAGVGGGGNPAGIELTGLQSIVDDTATLFNVNPSTYASWVAVDNGNSGTNRSFSENLAAKVIMDIDIAGGEEPNFAICSDGVQRSVAAVLQPLRRFNNTMDLKGGFKGVELQCGGVSLPLTWDRDCPANSIYFLNTEHLVHFEASDWEWMDDDGNVLSRVANTDAYEATLYKDHELATPKRNAHGRLVDITES